LKLNSCNFHLNEVEDWGYGVVTIIYSLSSLLLETNFTNNIGSAVVVFEVHMVLIWNCFFYNNTCEGRGGAVSVTKFRLELIFIANCSFEYNSATEGGSAISFDNSDKFTTLPYDCRNLFDSINTIIDKINQGVFYHITSIKSILGDSRYYNLTVIANCSFSYNQVTDETYNLGGAIYVSADYIGYNNYDYHDACYDQLIIIDSKLIIAMLLKCL